MRVLSAAEYRRMPWRNGGGETAEVAIGPVGATLDDFDWRVSMARIDDDGPFSVFPQIDRTLAVLRGDGLRLSIGGSEPVDLTRGSEPLAFPGDVDVDATLLGRPVTDLNVMTRRNHCTHSMRRIGIMDSVEFSVDASLALLVCAEGSVHVEANALTVTLATLDAFLLGNAPSTLRIFGDTMAVAYVIEIH